MPSETWLGKHSANKKIVNSGLWNDRFICGGKSEKHRIIEREPVFLDELEKLILNSKYN